MLELTSIWKPEVQQQNYRALLEAVSRPGTVQPVRFSAHDTDAVTAILATLLDGEVSLCDLDQQIDEDSWPLLQAVPRNADQADYVVCDGSKPPAFQPKLGSLASPEHSATLLLSVGSLTSDSATIRLQGPGIKEHKACSIAGLCNSWLAARADWVDAFPLGVDMLLIDRDSVLALPRSTQVEVL